MHVQAKVRSTNRRLGDRLATGQGLLLRCRGSVTPGQQFIDAGDLVIGDAAQNICEPALWVNAVQLGCLNQRVGNGR